MDATRCPKCNKRLIEEADGAGRIELRCLNCDAVDPLKTKAAKWAESSLAQPQALSEAIVDDEFYKERGGTFESLPPRPTLSSGSVYSIWLATTIPW